MAIGRTNAGGMSTADATAIASDILEGKTAYAGNAKVEGTMPNNTAETITLDTDSTSYTIPAGYHDGTGEVKLVTQNKSITPSTSEQSVSADKGRVLKKVTVSGYSSSLVNTDDADAEGGDILAEKTAYVKGSKVTGEISTYSSSDTSSPSKDYVNVAPTAEYQYLYCGGKYMPYNILVNPISFMTSGYVLSSDIVIGIEEYTAEYVAFSEYFYTYAQNASIIFIGYNSTWALTSEYEDIGYVLGALFVQSSGAWVPKLALVATRASSNKRTLEWSSSVAAYLKLNIRSTGTQYESISASVPIYAAISSDVFNAYFF